MFLQTGLGRASTRQLSQALVGGDWVLPRYSHRPHCPTPISERDFRKFKCTTRTKFRECVVSQTLFECVVSHTLFECVGNETHSHPRMEK